MTKILAVRGFEGKTVKIESYVRLIFWGGARTKSDNSTFSFAYKNVKTDYGSDKIIVNEASSAKDLVKIIIIKKIIQFNQ